MSTPVQALKPHVSINVRNVAASIEFYTKMLGIEPAKVRTGYAKFDLENPRLNLALNEVPDLASAGALSHLGIQVASTDDVLAVRERWIESGLLTRDEMATDCCWANQDKSWVRDPDGNEWEVFVVHKDLAEEEISAEAAACCRPKESAADEGAKAAGCCAPEPGSSRPVVKSACGCAA
ncbi:MAG TPA: ArsI/CadI family heavy metal resistance metalloenzyme [Thermoanaerobaculia bacterium]|nr:ArsI/CadI family heavy metal resistance metalloenzyme [Thermoanaerobaculia bacterium]